MTRLYFIATILLSLAMHTSQARSKDVVISDLHGTDLLRLCKTPEGTNQAEFCSGFILGIRDGVPLTTNLRNAAPIFEEPSEAKQDQLKAVVVKYLNDHPEEHHKPAGLLVLFALRKAFPPGK